jgi:hypothetical protein
MNIIESIKPYTQTSMHRTKQVLRVMTSPLRLAPDFIIIGGQRCGTTSLYNYLIEHPGIVPASTKEVHFFDYNFKRPFFWYRAQFPSYLHKFYIERVRDLEFVTGEATPYYLFHPLSPRRVAEKMPQVKLIVLLRNPIDRAYSQHWLESKLGYDTLSFEDAIKCEEERTAGEREKMLENANYESYSFRHYSYLSRGRYVEQLQTWMSYFPQKQFLILKSEDLYSNSASVVKQALEFLGAPVGEQYPSNKEFKQYREPTREGYKSNEKAPKMKGEVRERLLEYFKPYNARLYEFLGRDFGWDSDYMLPN